jgi:FlaA1/EpsC-like NDP-sugar epimerase
MKAIYVTMAPGQENESDEVVVVFTDEKKLKKILTDLERMHPKEYFSVKDYIPDVIDPDSVEECFGL